MEVFRFVALRPPQLKSEQLADLDGVHAYQAKKTPFVRELMRVRSLRDGRKRMIDLAENRLESDVINGGTDSMLKLIARVDDWEVGRTQATTASQLKSLVFDVAGQKPDQVVTTTAFSSARADLADRLVASMILGNSDRVGFGDQTVRRIRAAAVINLVGSDATVSASRIGAVLRAVVYIPPGIFPLPPLNDPDRAGRNEGNGQPDGERESRANELRASRIARDTVTELLEAQSSASPPARSGAGSTAGNGRRKRKIKAPFSLTEDSFARIDKSTARFLVDHSLDPRKMSVPSIVGALERRMNAISASLPSPIASSPIVIIGNQPTLGGEFFPTSGNGSGGTATLTPGPCIDGGAPEQPVPPQPLPVSLGVVRVAGIGELQKVEQTTRRYELGEIAHVENVLAGERRARRHRRTDTIEETFVTQVETTEESERDLQSTDRFELQKEAASVIASEASKDVGLTINASYGPTVDATLSSNFATSNSTENSSRLSTSYARETTERSIARLTRRTLESRTRRTLMEIVETNKHSFTNDDAAASNIVGVYRWVDKILESNLVRYGQRLFVECVIPEPAAFIRFSDSKRASELPDLQRPVAPGYCVDGTFQPLAADDLDEETYLDWAAAYELADVAPPPALLRVIGIPVKTEAQEDSKPWAETNAELIIPDGYRGVTASVSDLLDTEFIGPLINPFIYIGEKYVEVLPDEEVEGEVSLSNIEGAVPISIWSSASTLAYCFNVLACCARTVELFQKWQIDTFTSIMTAYNAKLSEYNERLAATEIGSIQIRGRNPLLAREIERTELKRLSIEMMTNQHFESFDSAVADAIGFPSIDVEEADREGRYIQFFEQAFEWTNMTYVFYPYFWSRKSQWPSLVALDDVDPLYARFLQAGAARVQLPVRPGYESSLIYFVESGGDIWQGGDPPHIDDPEYVSLVEEIRAIEGVANLVVGTGTLDVTSASATVTGTGTHFRESDVGREIVIAGERFLIREVVSPVKIVLSAAFGPPSATGLEYSVGGWYVGPPWEVRLPTSLVALQGDSQLPTWPSNRP